MTTIPYIPTRARGSRLWGLLGLGRGSASHQNLRLGSVDAVAYPRALAASEGFDITGRKSGLSGGSGAAVVQIEGLASSGEINADDAAEIMAAYNYARTEYRSPDDVPELLRPR